MEPPEDGTPKVDTFHCNFARLPLITKEVHDTLCSLDPCIVREHLPLELLDYYVTALLWARLLHIKRYKTPLTTEEDQYIGYFLGKVFNLPEPIYKYLMMIGHVSNLLPGWTLYLSDHTLPVSSLFSLKLNKSGYHALKIHGTNHSLFEEVPSLGVSGDCLMRLVSMGSLTEPLFPFLPNGTVATLNMVGYFGSASPVSEPVRQTLESFSITADEFKEDIEGTRLNFAVVKYVSNIIQVSKIFKLCDFSVTSNMSVEGSETQVIETRPACLSTPNSLDQTWTQISVQPQVYTHNNPECVKASYYAGFQLYKEPIHGSHLNWSCVKACGSWSVWIMASRWAYTRNIRRRERYRLWEMSHSVSGKILSQHDVTQEYVWNMICSEFPLPE